jgi:eukaryotic-like serine/threonine-protein kinase
VETFGRYLLEKKLAVGGMGEVFLAQQSGIAGFAKKLVVKRIKASLVDDPQFVEMFLNEGRVAALIDHPNVVHIYELGQVDGAYFIAMEYVPGRSLSSVLERLGGPLDLPQALYVLTNICEGLAYAHDAVGHDGQPLNLVHRDISPPNILIGYSGAVKISDFGIAKVEHHANTAVGVLKGKFAYLSPEQARGEPVDRRSDIFALGLVLFEMTVGHRANHGTTDTGMIFAAARRELPEPCDLLPDYPPELQGIFARATALDAAERYPNVKELQQDLLTFQLDRRMVVSAGSIGEWLRTIAGPDDEEEADEPVISAQTAREGPAPAGDVVIQAPPALAYEATQAAKVTPAHGKPADVKNAELSSSAMMRAIEGASPQGASPRDAVLAAASSAEISLPGEPRPVMLEVDLEKEAGGSEAPRRRGHRGGQLTAVGVVLLLLILGAGIGLMRWRQRASDAPAPGSTLAPGTAQAAGSAAAATDAAATPASAPTKPGHRSPVKPGVKHAVPAKVPGPPTPTPIPTPTPTPPTPGVSPLPPTPQVVDAGSSVPARPDAARAAPRPSPDSTPAVAPRPPAPRPPGDR